MALEGEQPSFVTPSELTDTGAGIELIALLPLGDVSV